MMKKPAFIAIVLILIAVSFATGYLLSNPGTGKKDGSARKILYYVDPMNPGFKSDKSGIAPCGMPLEPVYAESRGPDGADDHPGSAGAGAVKITPERQQVLGLRVGQVERSAVTHPLRLFGQVTADETKIYFINATIDGWITDTGQNTVGSVVKKNEVLAAFYSPDFLSAGQALLFALNSMDRVSQQPASENPAQQAQLEQFKINLKQYRDALRNLGMGEAQIEEMIRTRKYMENIDITSPTDGLILVRNVSIGQRFEKGKELYRIADLSRVWILADTYENEARQLKPGQEVKVTLPHRNKSFKARMSDVLPVFDPQTRTLKVRLIADNPGFELRPGMFVDVEIPISMPPAVVVPADAIIDTGLKKTVYVDRGDGTFEPRRVETGWRLGKQVEIVSGLTPGEKIVMSGNFLIDSESRMRAAAQGIFGSPTKDPVCGMFVDEDKTAAAGRTSKYQGKTYFFCSDPCKTDFEKDPKRYAQQGAKEPDAKTKEAMMKELGMQEKKAAEGIGKEEHRH